MRSKYLEMRKSSKYDLKWFYEYYISNINRSKNNIPLPFMIFAQIFHIYLQQFGDNIFDFLDQEFEVSYIKNENGEIIYIN